MRQLFLLLTLAAPTLAAESYRPKKGEQHPDFTLPTISRGEALSLSDYRGKKVLLIHFASW